MHEKTGGVLRLRSFGKKGGRERDETPLHGNLVGIAEGFRVGWAEKVKGIIAGETAYEE